MNDLILNLYKRYRDCPAVSIDSRVVLPGCLFFGLQGEKTDGSQFGLRAVEAGAGCAVVRAGSLPHHERLLFVDDPLRTLQDLAQYHRRHLEIPVIGITGSNGKTTTKELLHHVLSTHFRVTSTQGNLNNHIGVPLTILAIRADDELAIVEMGANHIGEVRALCEMARPTHGIVTNIGRAHLEGFGGIEGVKSAKSELYTFLSTSGGMAFVNLDEEFLSELSATVSQRIFYTCKGKEAADFSFSYAPERDGITFSVEGKPFTARSSLFGEYNLANLATAVTTGLHFGVPPEKICAAIGAYRPQNHRSQEIILGSNRWILDAYNANPTSVKAALDSFATIPATQKIIILGAMMELGTYAEEAHLEIAARACSIPGAEVILTGEAFREAARHHGTRWYPDVEALSYRFSKDPPAGALILLKGSRAMHLETLLRVFEGG